MAATAAGDLVSHDNDNTLGRDYVEYEESVIFGFFKKCECCDVKRRTAETNDNPVLGAGPTYAALGNVGGASTPAYYHELIPTLLSTARRMFKPARGREALGGRALTLQLVAELAPSPERTQLTHSPVSR